jgi:hypothetical protein
LVLVDAMGDQHRLPGGRDVENRAACRPTLAREHLGKNGVVASEVVQQPSIDLLSTHVLLELIETVHGLSIRRALRVS